MSAPRPVLRVLVVALAASIALLPGPVVAQDAPPAPDPGTDVSGPTSDTAGPAEDPAATTTEVPSDDTTGAETDEPAPEDAEGPLAPTPGATTCIDTASGCVDPVVLADLLEHYEAAADDEAAALADLSAGLDRLNDLEAQLRELNTRVAEVNLRLLAARSSLRYADIRVDVARQNLGDVEEALSGEESQLQDQAVAAFMGGADERELEKVFAILRSESGLEIESIRQYSEAILDDQQRTIDRVVALRLAVEGMNAELAEAEGHARAVKDEITTIESDLDALWSAHRELVAQAEVEVEGLGRIVGDIRARKDEYAAELFRSTAGAGGSIAVLLRDRQAGQELPERTVGILDNPVPGAPVVSNFGPRLHPILGYVRIHAGVDIDGSTGQAVRAAADGTVVLTEEQGGYGLVTVIDHGNGIGTVYAHQSAFAAKPGDVVARGDIIGFVGSTGLSTGPHVHFEVRLFGQAVDPMIFLDLGDQGTVVDGADAVDHHAEVDDGEQEAEEGS